MQPKKKLENGKRRDGVGEMVGLTRTGNGV